MEDLTFATLEEAQAAAQRDLDARRSGDPNYDGKRFVMTLVGEADLWVHHDDVGPDDTIHGFGVCDEAGEQMLGTDGEWYFVA